MLGRCAVRRDAVSPDDGGAIVAAYQGANRNAECADLRVLRPLAKIACPFADLWEVYHVLRAASIRTGTALEAGVFES